jgi:tetratricopeptide (TPR) repeat protein
LVSSSARVVYAALAISTRDIKSVRLLEQLAIHLRDSSYFDEALQILDRALNLDPDDPELLREAGFVYRKKRRDQHFIPRQKPTWNEHFASTITIQNCMGCLAVFFGDGENTSEL